MKQDLGCSANEMLFGQQLRLPYEFQPVMYTVPNNPLHFVSKLQEHFNSLEPTQARDQASKQAYVDHGLIDADRVLVRNDGYWIQTTLAMRYSGPYKVIEKHSKYYVILNSRQVPETVSIDRLKRFVERHSSDSADGDDLRASQESNEMSTIDTSADSKKAVSSPLNPEAQPWFPHSSKGRLLKPTKRLICQQ